ncbi:DUF192 domain-containing protein [Thermus filiformis]|uniref:DUF192 domain-containing protein n=1 Tax=Thermus filiformis TaxID=276 RepID=A0A0A2WSY3_THEFI|nr:DUF192 domain-containing protein [Thermus filiformis]KGQ22938.1 hypothetical protein THFILI_09035 [Thermus filiformis]
MFRLVSLALLLFLFVLSFLGYLLTGLRLREPPPPKDAVVQTAHGNLPLKVRLARTPGEWALGLGLRQASGYQGLLYLFPEATDRPFSTEGYRFGVSLALLDREGRILEIVDLEPGTTYAPHTAYRGILEMPQGWFQKQGVRPGDRVYY